MKASFLWLRALVPQLPNDPRAVAARLTAAGIEIEGFHEYGQGAEACEVVAVLSMRPHPSKSGLRLVTVNRGKGTLEVICGAPNVPDPGGLVVLAPLGAHLPAKGMTIEKRAIAGVVSEGMLCSESELGLSEEGGGILVLPPGTAEPGTKLVSAIPEVRDTILEVGLTPNRPDGLGHRGLARELAALYGLPWNPPKPDASFRKAGIKIDDLVRISIEDGERCPHYAGAALVDATVAPSPLAVKYRLAALGVRSISNLVDVTNLVMFETGHPLHAFDLAKVRGKRIVVRPAKTGETLKTLDGVDRKLDTDDLVIADAEGPIALAGVMGGADSEISATTKSLLIECAYFDPRSVRRTARRHGLHTDGSHRFERGIDHGDTESTLLLAMALTERLAGAAAAQGTSFVVAKPLNRAPVRLRFARMAQLLGLDVPAATARGILERLGFAIVSADAEKLELLAPTHRPDQTRECDAIDEVARVHGLDHIVATLPAVRASVDVGDQESLARNVRGAAVAVGLSETMLFGFTSKAMLDKVAAPAAPVVLKNPLADHQSVMRTSLLPGLLESVGRARRHGERDVGLFSVGRLFLAAKAEKNVPAAGAWPVHEPLSFAAVVTGERRAWLEKARAADAWDAKGIALGLVQRLGHRAEARVAEASARPSHLHPRAAGELVVGNIVIGSYGLLHPDAVDAFELGRDTAVVMLDLEALAALPRHVPQYVAIPRFPASSRDIALVVPSGVLAGAVEEAIRTAAGTLAERVEIFDRFTGGAVPEGHASLAFRVVYRSADRTLTDAEVDAQHGRVVAEVETRFRATLRA